MVRAPLERIFRHRDVEKFYIGALSSYFLLLAIYTFYIAPVWSAGGFGLDFSLLRTFISVVLLGGFTAILPIRTETTRGFFLTLILLIQLIPLLVLYSAGGANTVDTLIFLSGIAVVFVVSSVQAPIERFGFLSMGLVQILFVIMSALAVALLIIYNGVDSFNLNIANVYKYRHVALSDSPYIIMYVFPVVAKVLIPFGAVFSFYKKNYVLSLVFLICSVMLFGLTSHKSIVFYVIFSFILYILWNYWRKGWVVSAVFGAALVLAAIDAFIFRFAGWDWLWGWYASLGVRRALLVPALLNYLHLDFFWQNPQALWANSKITLGLIDYPYDLPIPNLIGREYYGSSETSANTGYLGSGFAQAGPVGLIAYSIGVGLVIAILDALGRKIGHRVVVAAASAQVVTMVLSADFVTMFLTHGLFVSVLVLLAIRPDAGAEKAAATPEVAS